MQSVAYTCNLYYISHLSKKSYANVAEIEYKKGASWLLFQISNKLITVRTLFVNSINYRFKSVGIIHR